MIKVKIKIEIEIETPAQSEGAGKRVSAEALARNRRFLQHSWSLPLRSEKESFNRTFC
jgi:hypothetical protein